MFTCHPEEHGRSMGPVLEQSEGVAAPVFSAARHALRRPCPKAKFGNWFSGTPPQFVSGETSVLVSAEFASSRIRYSNWPVVTQAVLMTLS